MALDFLVVVHGSRNPEWVAAQKTWFLGVLELIRPHGINAGLSFLEISEPLFAETLQELDGRYSTLKILPFFLSKSGHVGEEIPEIVATNLKHTKGIIVEPEGLSRVIGNNAGARLKMMGAKRDRPVIVSGYGSSNHDEQWQQLIQELRGYAGHYTDSDWWWAPAGHFLNDDRQPLRDCLQRARSEGIKDPAILPLYLSVSGYQEKLIPEVIAEFPDLEPVFAPTAVLPDQQLCRWAAELMINTKQLPVEAMDRP